MRDLISDDYEHIRFSPNKVAFGRHETFALRYGWLTKGYQAAETDLKVFDDDEATVKLGVGVNMVASIRYWLRACQILDSQSGLPTQVGKLIFDRSSGYDPYLEDEATLWLLHWLLASNAQLATAWFWFFNKFYKTEFTSQELATALSDWVRANLKTKVSASTIKADAAIVLRMYTLSKGNTRTPMEEALDSPLAILRLVSQSAGGRSFQSRPMSRPGLPTGIFGFALTQTIEQRNVTAIPIEDLMYSKDDLPALGSTFRLTENDLITKLENLISYIPGKYEIRETAGIHQLYKLGSVDANQYLAKHYARSKKGIAA